MYHIGSLEKISRLINDYNICPFCLARLLYERNKGFLKFLKKLHAELVSKKLYSFNRNEPCYLCNGIMPALPKTIHEIESKLESYNFKSFSFGTKIPEILYAREDFIRSKYSMSSGLSLKSYLNYMVSNYLSRKLGKVIDINRPDLRIVYDFGNALLEITPSSVYIYGRYLKLKRGVRQTKQFCRLCYGLGCKACNYRGYTDDPSIEGYILDLFRDEFFGEASVLHAAGREDIDVVTLNTGRPFVIEVKRPLKRSVDLMKIQDVLNSRNKGVVELKGLRYVDREIMEKINVFSKYDEKSYRLVVKFHNEIDQLMLEKIEKELSNRVIAQRTPLRVIYRRADKIRYKTVYSLSSKLLDKQTVEFIIRCQGGLYIKELAHGDQGRTNPSIFSISKIPLEVISLDVISVAPELEKRLGLD
ncbi:MAG TPA: tRNA pseudouridine(54/55) synthase Pus10 [Geobacterales bacterium]|nr:tRNA pseudouridine(54/55) synthase Pus10 [Geobacterales bacterium]